MQDQFLFLMSLVFTGVCFTIIKPIIDLACFRTAWSILVGIVTTFAVWLAIPVLLSIAIDPPPFFSRWLYFVISSIYFPFSFAEYWVANDGYSYTRLAPLLGIRLVTSFVTTAWFEYRINRAAYTFSSNYFFKDKPDDVLHAELKLSVIFKMNGAAIAIVAVVVAFLDFF